jgi:alcohol dehydrogenase class IV
VAAPLAFEIAAPSRIIFGSGKLGELGSIAKDFGRHALVVTGRSAARAAPVFAALGAASIRVSTYAVSEEPTLDVVRAATAAAREAGADIVVAIGGGSPLDAGKAVAALLTNGGDPLDYLEVVGRGRAISRRSAPFIAIPTTAGPGSEVTRNAVIASPEHGVKASMRSALMLPHVALVDPDLLQGLSAEVIAASGLDALSQLIESLVSARANPFSDGLAREGIRRSAAALATAHASAREGHTIAPAHREALATASLFGGLCLAHAGLGAVHGFAAPLGGMFGAPHGAVCAALLGPVSRANVAALSRRAPASAALARYHELGALLSGRSDATAENALAFIDELSGALQLRRLGHYGLKAERVPELVAKARAASSMKSNPIVLTEDELTAIAMAAL